MMPMSTMAPKPTTMNSDPMTTQMAPQNSDMTTYQMPAVGTTNDKTKESATSELYTKAIPNQETSTVAIDYASSTLF